MRYALETAICIARGRERRGQSPRSAPTPRRSLVAIGDLGATIIFPPRWGPTGANRSAVRNSFPGKGTRRGGWIFF